MHEHVANGILSAKTHWRDYCIKVIFVFLTGTVWTQKLLYIVSELTSWFQVKDSPAYLEVSSNTSGSTAKDLFEDVIEDLGKQVHKVIYFI